MPLHFFQKGTGGAKEAKENDARLAKAVSAFGMEHHRRCNRDRAIRTV